MNLPLTIVGDQLWKKISESMDRVELRLRKVIAILEPTGIPLFVDEDFCGDDGLAAFFRGGCGIVCERR